MVSICFYLHAHQPLRLKKFSLFNVGSKEKIYFDERQNKFHLQKAAQKSYLPASQLFLELIRKTKGKFKVSLSLSGVLLKQLEEHAPAALKGFQQLVKTGACELISETHYHTLASYFSEKEFRHQVLLHHRELKRLFGYNAKVFRNTELLYYDNLANIIYDLGYKGVLIEGADKALKGKPAGLVYSAKGIPALKLLSKHYRLSDDIAFRFSNRSWEEFPLTPDKYLSWVKAVGRSIPEGSVNIFMDYETFGEHQWQETGIFGFFKEFVLEASVDPEIEFLTPSMLITTKPTAGELSVKEPLTWADTERDLSAWLGNLMQREAANELYSLENKILKTRNKEIIHQWRHLQTSDHFYYMCTKWFSDGDVHKYFNPYESPYDAYINYMNVLRDLESKIKA